MVDCQKAQSFKPMNWKHTQDCRTQLQHVLRLGTPDAQEYILVCSLSSLVYQAELQVGCEVLYQIQAEFCSKLWQLATHSLQFDNGVWPSLGDNPVTQVNR